MTLNDIDAPFLCLYLVLSFINSNNFKLITCHVVTFWVLTLHIKWTRAAISAEGGVVLGQEGVGGQEGGDAGLNWGGYTKWHHTGRTEEKTHINEILVEAFPQVVQEGTLTRVGVQEDKVLDAHAIPGRQRGLHVPQDPAAPLLQALWAKQDHVSLIHRCPPSLTGQFCAKVVNHL